MRTKEQKLEQQDKRLRKKYGITLDQRKAMRKAQGKVCAICKGDNGGRSLCVDHNHKTKMVRGLLCFRCNKYIVGRFRDGALLRAAADYLDRKVALGLVATSVIS